MKRWMVLSTIFVFTILMAETLMAQVVVRDSVRIARLPSAKIRPQMDKSPQPTVVLQNGVVSGFVIPYRANLQIYYNFWERLDWYPPPWASLITIFDSDSVVVDSLFPRFPEVTIAPLTYFNGCFSSFEQHDWIYFTNFSAPEDVYRFNVGLAEAGDTVLFVYDTESLFTGQRDTLGIWDANEVRLSDGTLVGWNVNFGEYDYCLDTWNDNLEIFIGLLPSTIEMTFSPAVISPGDTAAIILKKVNPDGTREDFPPGQNFEIGIVKGSADGGILSPTPTPLVSDYFLDFEQPFAFIAESNITADSVVVQIRAGIPTASSAAASTVYHEMRLKAQQQATAYLKAKTPESAVRSAPVPSSPEPITKKNSGQEITARRGKGGQRLTSDMPESEFVYSDFAKANIVFKQFLDHFAVTVTPDIIAYTDTATVAVQAKDKNGNDITIPDATLLDFALDANGELYGNLVAPNGSQAKSLMNVAYGDARTGKVKYVANGTRPDSMQQVLITASKSDDALKNGSGSVAIEVTKLTIDIPDPETIWPTLPAGRSGGNPQNRNIKNPITVKANRSNQPMTNQSVTITARIIPLSGGHDHTNQPPLDSLGVFRTSSGTMRGSITSSTDANGEIRLSYQAPVFGGQIELTATALIDDETLAVKDTLIVRVPGLDELDGSPLYELVGAPGNHSGTNDPCRANPPTSQHNRNHYGTQALRTAIQNIAASYDSLHPGIRLRINDMSLEWGGLFDNQNNWRYIVGVTHGEHRIGRNADIGFSGIDPNNQCVNLNQLHLLRRIRRYTDVNPVVHPNDHVHIRVSN